MHVCACTRARRKGCTDPIRQRALNLSGNATTLTSSYHDLGNHTTKYVFKEGDDQCQYPPRFLT